MLGGVFEELLTVLGSNGSSAAIRQDRDRGDIARSQLCRDILGTVAGMPSVAGGNVAGDSVWVGARDPYLMLVSTVGCLHSASVALVEPDDPAARYDTLTGVCPPALVVCDQVESSLARWACATGRPVWLADRDPRRAAAGGPARTGMVLRFFTSGTTGTPKCVGVDAAQLFAAFQGVAGRLALTPEDTSLGVAPLTHTLGLVTTVLAALASGGSVTFADPRRPREFLTRLSGTRPTWCAASPSAHQIAYKLLSSCGVEWPGLRFLRASSAPPAVDLVRRMEEYYGVPVINAYAMTEAPGEIASQAIDGERRAGTVGRPTLCEVDVRSPDGREGEVWVRGPNVVCDGWLRTGDIGALDGDGFLRLTGRVNDIINHGGLKVWPPDVEAVALDDPAVTTAVAFPIPHHGLGEIVGLAVVAAAGRAVDRGALRRRLMSALPRHACPGTIVVCADIPKSARGKVQRRALWQQLPGIRARVDT
jgi:oxalate---CoA ligase